MTVHTMIDEILGAVRGFVVAAFRDGHGEGLGSDTSLVTSGIIDSTGVLEVVEFLEGRFGIHVADEDVQLQNFDTLQAMAQLVARKLA